MGGYCVLETCNSVKKKLHSQSDELFFYSEFECFQTPKPPVTPPVDDLWEVIFLIYFMTYFLCIH